MEEFEEVTCVRETEHLVPNLPRLASVLFGPHSYFLDWRKSHIDWATARCKQPDGLVWCPWSRELWLVEAEWKEQSNFFEQSRAFASGRVDMASLSKALRACLNPMAEVVNSVATALHLQENFFLGNIVKETLSRHFHGNELRPHAWVVLGHDAENFEELRCNYERELQDRFKGSQRYILSMVRMFKHESAAYLLLEQHGPSLGSIKKATLVPAVSTGRVVESLPNPMNQVEPTRDTPIGPRTFSTLSQATSQASEPSTTWSSHTKRKLEVKILERENLWRTFVEQGQMSVQDFKRLSEFPLKAVAGFIRFLTENRIATRRGNVFTLCESAAPLIRHVLTKSDQAGLDPQSDHTPDYLANWSESTWYKIEAKILEREKLWEVFLEKKQLSVQDFKQPVRIPPQDNCRLLSFPHHEWDCYSTW